MTLLRTPRLELIPITLDIVDAVVFGDRAACEALVGARMPEAWPGRELIEQAFCVSVDAMRAEPARRLWGHRVMVADEGERRVVGSVVFHEAPGDDGVVAVGYGVEAASQGRGFATEATRASVEWALAQRPVRKVTATTPLWHVSSQRVLVKVGMRHVSSDDHPALGELLVYEIDAPS